MNATPVCICPVDGFCARYKRDMILDIRRMCRGELGDPKNVAVYRRNWEALARTCRPGAELKAILATLGVSGDGGCGCTERAHHMDVNGVEWCRENRSVIIGWLQESAAKRDWGEKIRAGWKLKNEAWWNPLDPFGSLVDEAIRRSIAAAESSETPQ